MTKEGQGVAEATAAKLDVTGSSVGGTLALQ
jgi:hypothetical protein